jgi:L-amino acid N-acyltransferase YncA
VLLDALIASPLIASTEAAGIWTIETGIFPENVPSLRLHERIGFELVGRRKRIGKRDGVWATCSWSSAAARKAGIRA